jgi:hypothetical protein
MCIAGFVHGSRPASDMEPHQHCNLRLAANIGEAIDRMEYVNPFDIINAALNLAGS